MENDPSDVRQLYTPAMLAQLLRVPVTAIRRWHRKGHLVARTEVKRLPYFDATEVHAARLLAELVHNECSLSLVDRRMDQLALLLPDVARPLVDLPIVVEGRRLLVRRGDDLTEPGGQLLMEFDPADEPDEPTSREPSAEVIRLPGAATADAISSTRATAAQLRELALDYEAEGALDLAVETYRALMMTGDSNAADQFALAEVLYRQGDVTAARERYYLAIELDEDFVEARSNLGCVLAELGDVELAEASLRGALAFHDEYADAHFHLAQLLRQQGRRDEALIHWRRFLELAPESPWADEAQQHVAEPVS